MVKVNSQWNTIILLNGSTFCSEEAVDSLGPVGGSVEIAFEIGSIVHKEVSLSLSVSLIGAVSESNGLSVNHTIVATNEGNEPISSEVHWVVAVPSSESSISAQTDSTA